MPNKFSALARDVQPERIIHRSRRTINGFGVHDVIIETPDHWQVMGLMTGAQVADVLRIYKARYSELSLDQHPHCQLQATPVISLQVRQRFQEALRHYGDYGDYGDCMLCQTIEDRDGEGKRIVQATEHFVDRAVRVGHAVLHPYLSPADMASFGDISGNELTDLGRVLRSVLAKLYHGLENPDFNYTIRTAPAELIGARYFHWYLSVIPRLTQIAGFELGSGMFINTVLPEATAEFLRNVKVEESRPAVAER